MIIWRPKHEVRARSAAIRRDLRRRYNLDDLRQQLYREQDGLCGICKKPLQSADSIITAVEHAIPVFLYATWDYLIEEAANHANAKCNLLAAHHACNTAKRERDFDEIDAAFFETDKQLRSPNRIEDLKSERNAAMRKRSQDPAYVAANMAAAKKRSRDPAYRAAVSGGLKRRYREPEYKAKHNAAMKKMHSDPKYRAKQNEVLKKLAQDPKWRAANKAGVSKRFENPETRAAQAEIMRKAARVIVIVPK